MAPAFTIFVTTMVCTILEFVGMSVTFNFDSTFCTGPQLPPDRSFLYFVYYRLISTRNNLITRVADFVKLDPSLLKLKVPPARMPHAKVTFLRVIQVWVFHDAVIEYRPLPLKPNSDGSLTVSLKNTGHEIQEAHLASLLRSDRHPYTLHTHACVEQTGGILAVDNQLSDLLQFLIGFEERFVSYCLEKEVDIGWFLWEDGLYLYVFTSDIEEAFEKLWADFSDESVLKMCENIRRGRGERPAGRWTVCTAVEAASSCVTVRKFKLRETSFGSGINNALRNALKKKTTKKGISFDFSKNLGGPKKRKNAGIHIYQCGNGATKMTERDFTDLLAVANRKDSFWLLDKRDSRSQSITFENPERSDDSEDSLARSNCPLLKNAPEGSRILAVLAASRRRETQIQIPIPFGTGDDEEGGDNEIDEYVSFFRFSIAS